MISLNCVKFWIKSHVIFYIHSWSINAKWQICFHLFYHSRFLNAWKLVSLTYHGHVLLLNRYQTNFSWKRSPYSNSETTPNPPTRMVFIALMRIPHKQFCDMASELMIEKIGMVSRARHHVYTRIKKWRRMIEWGNEREERGLDVIYFLSRRLVHEICRGGPKHFGLHRLVREICRPDTVHRNLTPPPSLSIRPWTQP